MLPCIYNIIQLITNYTPLLLEITEICGCFECQSLCLGEIPAFFFVFFFIKKSRMSNLSAVKPTAILMKHNHRHLITQQESGQGHFKCLICIFWLILYEKKLENPSLLMFFEDEMFK